AARKAGRFKDEIVPVTVTERKGTKVIDSDEYIREGATYDNVSGLRPAFAKDGTVTAGNASGLNDGAAALVLMSADEAKKRGLTPLCTLVADGTHANDPSHFTTAPAGAIDKALAKASLKAGDVDLWEKCD